MNKDLKRLIVFFLGTLAWTWAFYLPIGFFHLDWSRGIWLILFLAGGFGHQPVGVAALQYGGALLREHVDFSPHPTYGALHGASRQGQTGEL